MEMELQPWKNDAAEMIHTKYTDGTYMCIFRIMTPNIDDEDFALCSFACPSKIDVGKVIRNGLDLMELEG